MSEHLEIRNEIQIEYTVKVFWKAILAHVQWKQFQSLCLQVSHMICPSYIIHYWSTCPSPWQHEGQHHNNTNKHTHKVISIPKHLSIYASLLVSSVQHRIVNIPTFQQATNLNIAYKNSDFTFTSALVQNYLERFCRSHGDASFRRNSRYVSVFVCVSTGCESLVCFSLCRCVCRPSSSMRENWNDDMGYMGHTASASAVKPYLCAQRVLVFRCAFTYTRIRDDSYSNDRSYRDPSYGCSQIHIFLCPTYACFLYVVCTAVWRFVYAYVSYVYNNYCHRTHNYIHTGAFISVIHK